MLIIFLGVLLAAVLFGLLAAAVWRLPPLRRFGRRSNVTAILIIYAMGALVSGTGFAVLTRGLAEVEYVVITEALTTATAAPQAGLPPAEWQTQWRQAQLQPAVVQELWLRLLRPPALRRPVCYSGQAVACRLVAEFASHEPSYLELVNTEAWSSYLGLLTACLAGALANGLALDRLLRPSPPASAVTIPPAA